MSFKDPLNFETEFPENKKLNIPFCKCLSLRTLIILIVSSILIISTIIILSISLSSSSSSEDYPILNKYSLKFTENEGPLGNPLKGWVMWVNKRDPIVPLSLEFFKLHLSDLWPKENYINFTYFEGEIEKVKNRKRQVIVRLVLENPGEEGFSPKWFLDYGSFNYDYSGKKMTSPDYNNEKILSLLDHLFEELGKKYNGDKRIAFWQLGTYGHWGEFHLTYAKDHEATLENKIRIMDMTLKNFDKTMSVIRYPDVYTQDKGVGFYHDVFGDERYDVSMEKYFNRSDQWDRWETYVFGGELYPKMQEEFFGNKTLINEFNYRAKQFHPSWLYDNHFYKNQDSIKEKYPNFLEERNKAERLMGYNYFVKEANIEIKGKKEENKVNVGFSIKVGNKGLAPFYLKWKVNFGIIKISKNEKGNEEVNVIREDSSEVEINGILPGKEKNWDYIMNGVEKSLNGNGEYFYAFRINSGIDTYVRMANDEQREDGWFIISKFIVS